jgi:WS/DGAT/MGAT family acyltransferase
MAEALSAADRASLAAERGPVNMSVGAALVFDAGPGVRHGAVIERLQSRLHLIPRYRQRLESAPLGLAGPVWVDDRDFDLEWHVRHATLPEPGGREQLASYLAREMSRRLDRARPLWELHVIEGVDGERVAVVPKMHHALVDGVAAVDVGTVLLDPSEEPLDIPPPDAPWAPEPHSRALQVTRLLTDPLARTQRLMGDAAARALEADPRRTARDLRSATELMIELTRTRPQAPMSALNRPISPNRRYATARCELSALKQAGRAGGGTVNDALLAAVAGMLRRCLELPSARPPVALVPVSVREEGEDGELGNRISTVFVDLPAGVEDPIERVRTVSDTMRELKQSSAVQAGAVLVGATGRTPPVVSSLLVRAMGGVRAFNLVVSNVPGPQQPFYLAGARLRETYPAVPLNPANQGLTVGILSYDGCVHFGLLADRELEPGVDLVRDALEASLAELAGAAA